MFCVAFPRWRRIAVGLATAVLGLTSMAASAQAETRAVVVGIDDYINVPKLKGAVADAKDISAVLRKRGVKDLTVLLDAEATRKSVLNAIDQLIARARKDDLAIITLAGHGAQEQWGTIRPPGTNKGASHEVYLLKNVTRPNTEGKIDSRLGGSAEERILGTEIAVRLKQLDDKGVRTIFVADACHGAGLTRESISGAPSVPESFRSDLNVVFYADGADPLESAIGQLRGQIDTDKELRLLTFLAAVESDKRAPEIEIPKGSGTMRGALSYAFARAMEGEAKPGSTGDLIHGDLLSFVKASVSSSMLDSGKGQKPDLRPRSNFERVVVKFGSDLAGDSAPTEPAAIPDIVKIYSQNGSPVEAFKKPQRGFAIQPVSSLAEADVIFNPASGDVFSRGGDLIAMRLGAADLEGLAEREVAIRRLVELSRPRARSLSLDKGDRRYFAGDEMTLNAGQSNGSSGAGEYFVFLVISGDGKVQFQYPRGKDAPTLPSNGLLGQMVASEPFGADYAVLVVDEKPIEGLVKALCQLDGGKDTRLVVSLIERALTPTMKIGLQGIYTAPKRGSPASASTPVKLCPEFRSN